MRENFLLLFNTYLSENVLKYLLAKGLLQTNLRHLSNV